MKVIELTKGAATIVDDEDFERLAQWRWKVNNRGYAVRSTRAEKGFRNLYMHRDILNPPPNLEVDHINGNPLDNRRCNLRLATRSQNLMNTGVRSDSTSGVKGVYATGKRFCAYIKQNGKKRHIGTFDSVVDAKLARDAIAMKLHGEFVRLN